MAGIIIAVIGFLIMAGTAGSSDADITMSLGQIVLQLIVGLLVMVFGIGLAASEEV